ncbi:MAG TPA: BTAD domain-containing putative transcriptional regulator [Kribbella sp.]|nr:BTAD domain-containing putative transcriptional regulator [Kribbella sp.]
MTTELTLLSRVAFRDQEITGPRVRGLVALLAGELRSGRSTGRLVEGLWPDERPVSPTKALQVLVSRARSQLGPGIIASTHTGYRLSLSEEQVDTSAVLLRASASARHSSSGDHAAALAVAEAGLAFWAGAPDLEPELDDPLSVLRREAAMTYRSLVRARALAQSRLGQSSQAVEALTELFRERPRDEEVLLELLRCEAATLGPPTALARYEAYRRSLRDELGTDPGSSLLALHQHLLQSQAPAIRHGIEYEPNPLLGRDEDLAAVASLLRSSRVTSIVGAGGLGKTRLAHVVSRQAEQRVVHFVALAGVTLDEDVVSEVAAVLGVADTRRTSVGHLAGPSDVLAGIASALGPGPALLVLDNCEHLIRGSAELVQALVSMTRELRVLTTSRSPLGLSSESVYQLPGLTLPTTVELFSQRAMAARPGIDLPADVVEELCRHLDGLPLAAELAAARVRVMSVAEIARRLEDRFALLRGGPRDAPERHRTLHAVVDWSWNLLEPAGQAALRALSVFPGGFTADAAEHLLGDADTLRILEHLVDQSLLEVVDTPSGARFRMLETVREFGTAHREAAGENDRVVDGFLAWARDFGAANHQAVFGADPFASSERIRAEQDNLLRALRLGLTRSDGPAVAATSAVLGSLWVVDTDYMRLTTLEETAWVLSHFRPGPDLVEATRTASTLTLASIYMFQGLRATRSLVTLRRLPLAKPDTLIRATAAVLRAIPDLPGPQPSALGALSDSDEPLLAGVANGIASYLWEREGDLGSALKAARRMLEAFDLPEHPWIWGTARSRAGELCLQVEQGAEAARHLGEALQVQEKLGARSDMVGQLRWGLVLANLQLGAIDEAERWLELAAQSQGDEASGTMTFGLGVRAEISLARADVDAGLGLWRRAVDGLKKVERPISGVDSALDPWALEVQAVTVTAHAQHGRPDLVEELTTELPHRLTTMLTDPLANPPAYLMELAICGALLLALAMVDLDRGARTGDEQATASGVRMIALAERFRFLRNFHPTMSSARARHAAEHADKAAYDDAVSSYAGLDRAELRAAALALLRERAQR